MATTRGSFGAPAGKFTTIATDTTIAGAAAAFVGAQHVVYETTAAGAGGIALTLPTAAALWAADPDAVVGRSFLLTIVSQGGGTVTVTTNTGLTLTGTMTIATKTTRTFVVTYTSATAVVVKSVSKGTIE